jgi:hypothetical protein
LKVKWETVPEFRCSNTERNVSEFEGGAAGRPNKSKAVSSTGRTWRLDSKEVAKVDWFGGE